MSRFVLLATALLLTTACASRTGVPSPGATARVRALADAYMAAYFERYPEAVTQYGIANRTHDRLTDNSLAALAEWEGREDDWLRDFQAIDAASLVGTPEAVAHANLENGSVPLPFLRGAVDRWIARVKAGG